MQVQQKQFTGLVADLMPNIRLMRFVGHFLNKFSNGSAFLNKMYSLTHLMLMLMQFVFIIVNLALNTSEVNELTANTVTTLHFTHTITKFCYLAMNNKNFYRTFNIWNQSNSHPLFAESDARYHSIALAKMRKNLYMITGLTLATVAGKFLKSRHNIDFGFSFQHFPHLITFPNFCLVFQMEPNSAWSVITFFGESVAGRFDKETNETFFVEVPRLPFKSYYPWNAMSGIAYMGSFAFQVTKHGGRKTLEKGQFPIDSREHTHSNQILSIFHRFTTCSSRCWPVTSLMSFSAHGFASLANNCAT